MSATNDKNKQSQSERLTLKVAVLDGYLLVRVWSSISGVTNYAMTISDFIELLEKREGQKKENKK